MLGNLELDFSKSDGSVYETIILAGENGTGKTTVLDSLSTFLNKGSIMPFDYIEYIADRKEYKIIPNEKVGHLGYHTRFDHGNGEGRGINSGRSNNENSISSDREDLRYYGFAYSKARSGFKTGKVTSVTTNQIDSNKYEPDAEDDYTKIKQLLIDIDGQDSSTWMKLSKEGGISDDKYNAFYKQSKGYRFESAFNSFFE